MSALIAILFILAGLINFVPIIGVMSDSQIISLYQLSSFNSDMSLLLRHRAILLGIVGSLLITSAFRHQIRTEATLAGLVSMTSFIALLLSIGVSNASLVNVAWADVVAILILSIAYALHLKKQSNP